MGELNAEILKLLKLEGYRTNEAILDAVDDMIEVVVEENEEMEADDGEDGDDD